MSRSIAFDTLQLLLSCLEFVKFSQSEDVSGIPQHFILFLYKLFLEFQKDLYSIFHVI